MMLVGDVSGVLRIMNGARVEGMEMKAFCIWSRYKVEPLD